MGVELNLVVVVVVFHLLHGARTLIHSGYPAVSKAQIYKVLGGYFYLDKWLVTNR